MVWAVTCYDCECDGFFQLFFDAMKFGLVIAICFGFVVQILLRALGVHTLERVAFECTCIFVGVSNIRLPPRWYLVRMNPRHLLPLFSRVAVLALAPEDPSPTLQ